MSTQFYQYHLFFCTNERDEGESCCANFNAGKIRKYAKERLKQLGLHGEGHCRANLAGCLGRCESGPVVVVYPEATWYTYVDEEDIDEIIEQHIKQGKFVKRLLI